MKTTIPPHPNSAYALSINLPITHCSWQLYVHDSVFIKCPYLRVQRGLILLGGLRWLKRCFMMRWSEHKAKGVCTHSSIASVLHRAQSHSESYQSVHHRESRLLRHTHKKIAVNLGVMPKTYTKWCPLLPKVYAMAQNITVRLDSYMSTASCFIEFEKFLRCLSCSLTIDISMQQLCSRFSHFRYRTDLREKGFCKISLLLFIANEVWGEGAM